MQFIYSQEEQQILDQTSRVLNILSNALNVVQQNFETTKCTDKCEGCMFKNTVISDNVCLMKRYIDKSLAPKEEVKTDE